MEFDIPDALATRVASADSDSGAGAWLAGLKSDIDFAVDVYGLVLVRQLPLGQDLAISLLVSLVDGQMAVLRAVEDRDAARRQAMALDLWRGRPAVDLLAADVDRRILLVEALDSDRDLHSVDQATSARVAAEVLSELWLPAPPHHNLFPTRSAADFVTGVIDVAPTLLDAGQAARSRRGRAAERLVVLHGDLHRGNVLARADGSWAAIDPHPAIGPAAVDLAILISDLISDEVGSPTGRDSLTALIKHVVTSAGTPDVDAAGVLDWMLLHRLNRVATAAREGRDSTWDIEFAELIMATVNSTVAVRTKHPS